MSEPTVSPVCHARSVIEVEAAAVTALLDRLGVKLITMTGKVNSTMAQQSNACINVSVDKEACPHNLAPTASTTATLVMGDALAVVVQRMREYAQHGPHAINSMFVVDETQRVIGALNTNDLLRAGVI